MSAEVYVQDGRKREGWWWVDNEAFDMKLKPTTFMVYCYLARICDDKSSVAVVSYRTLAKKLGLSLQTVCNAIQELEEKGMILKRHRTGRNGNQIANLYFLVSKEKWAPKFTSAQEKGVSRKNGKSTNLGELLEEVRTWDLERLSPEQAVFFILNSPLNGKIVEKEIRKADRNTRIRNPVGYLIDTLQVDTKKAVHRELLLVEREEAEEASEDDQGYDWRKLWERKVRKIRTIAGKYGIDIPEPESEKEAHEILRRIQRIVAEKADIPEEIWEKARELARGNKDMEVSFALSFAGVDTSLFSLTTL